MRIGKACAAAASCVLLAGCGVTHPQPGAALFARNCSLCHSLIGNESLRRQGGDLLRARRSRPILLQFAREMPVRRPLSERQLGQIVDYIRRVQASGAGK
jgi:mono/diheme cytochrome c family protein